MGTQILTFMSVPVLSSGAAFVTLAFPVGNKPPAWNLICYHQAQTSLFLTINKKNKNFFSGRKKWKKLGTERTGSSKENQYKAGLEEMVRSPGKEQPWV